MCSGCISGVCATKNDADTSCFFARVRALPALSRVTSSASPGADFDALRAVLKPYELSVTIHLHFVLMILLGGGGYAV